MKLPNKLTLATLSATAATLAASVPAFATEVNPCPDSEPWGNLCRYSGTSIGSVISSVVTAILVITAVVALFFLIWGGFKWVTSGGDKGKVEEARSTIIAAVIGLIVAFLAFFILSIVLGFFGLNLGNLQLPTITF